MRASSAARLLTRAGAAPAVVYLGLVAADYAHSLGRGFLSNDSIDKRLWARRPPRSSLLALGVVLAWARGRRARAAVARLVVELGEAPAPGGLRDVLARALGDPELELAYPVDDGRQVDAHGPAVELPQRMGERSHRWCAADSQSPCSGTAPACSTIPGWSRRSAPRRLALEHERLQAEPRAQLEQLRASRARTVGPATASAAGSSATCTTARSSDSSCSRSGCGCCGDELADEPSEHVDAAEAELRAALDDLRELARGIYPAVLADEGLARRARVARRAGTVPIASAAARPSGSLPRSRPPRTSSSPRSSSGPARALHGLRRPTDGRLLIEVDDHRHARGRPRRPRGPHRRARRRAHVEPDRRPRDVRAEVPCGS